MKPYIPIFFQLCESQSLLPFLVFSSLILQVQVGGGRQVMGQWRWH
ncbi:hypothetical protein V6Z11_D08G173500 [Gossypium hirsutum]